MSAAPMRVLFVSDVYFPRVNGVSTSIATFRADLAAARVETTLVVPQYGAAPALPDDERVIRVSAGKVPRDPEDRRMRWRELLRSLHDLRDRQFDLVHVHTPFLAHYAGVRFARAMKIPVVETYHTFFEEYLHHYVPLLPRVLGRKLAQSVTRSQCAQVDAVIAPSQPMHAMLRASGIERPIQVIPTGMPADRFVRGDGARFRREHDLPPDRPLLLYVGRVAHEKNIGFLLEMLLDVRRSRPDALLVIAGEGPARVALAAQVARLGLEREVVFIGYLDRERSLPDCYAAASVFVFASRTETQGLVLLEAMAQACPVVSTAHLGTASILQAGCGARVAPDEPGGFAQAVVALLDEPARAARYGVQGQVYARGWTSASMARRMHEFYADVCARAKMTPLSAVLAGTGEPDDRQACLDS